MTLAVALKEAGNGLYKRKRYADAIQKYMQAMALLPHHEAILMNIAQCYVRLKEWDDAIEFSNRVLLINPRHVKALSRRSASYYHQGQLDKALEDINKAVDLAPEIDDLLAEQRLYQGEVDDNRAEAELHNKLKANPILVEMNTLIDKYLASHEEMTMEELRQWYQVILLLLKRPDQQVLLRTRGVLPILMKKLDHVDGTACDLLNVLIEASRDCRRTQETLFERAFLETVIKLLRYTDDFQIPKRTICLVYECMDLKVWKNKLLSDPFFDTLLMAIQDQHSKNVDPEFVQKACMVLFALSGYSSSIRTFEQGAPNPLALGVAFLELSKQDPSNTKLVREAAAGLLSNLSTSKKFQMDVQKDKDHRVSLLASQNGLRQ